MFEYLKMGSESEPDGIAVIPKWMPNLKVWTSITSWLLDLFLLLSVVGYSGRTKRNVKKLRKKSTNNPKMYGPNCDFCYISSPLMTPFIWLTKSKLINYCTEAVAFHNCTTINKNSPWSQYFQVRTVKKVFPSVSIMTLTSGKAWEILPSGGSLAPKPYAGKSLSLS